MFSENSAGSADQKSSAVFTNVSFSKPILFSGKQYTRQDELLLNMLSDWNSGVSFCLDGQLVSNYLENALPDPASFVERKIRFAKSMIGDRDTVFFIVMYSMDPSIKRLFWKGFDFGALHEYGISLVNAYRKNSRAVAGCENPEDVEIVQSAVPMIENGLLRFYLSHSSEPKKKLYGVAIKKVEDRLAENPEDYQKLALILGHALKNVSRVRATFDVEGNSFEELMSVLRKSGDIPDVLERKLKAKPELISDDDFRSFLIRYSSEECSKDFVWEKWNFPSLRDYGIRLCEVCNRMDKFNGNPAFFEKELALLNSAHTMMEYGLIRFYLSRAGEEVRNLYLPAVERAEKKLAQKPADRDSVALILGTELSKVLDLAVNKKENINPRTAKKKTEKAKKYPQTKIKMKVTFKSPEHLLGFLSVIHDTDCLVYWDFLVKLYEKLQAMKGKWPALQSREFSKLCPEKNGLVLNGKTGCFGYFGSAEQVISYIDMLFKSCEYFFLHDFYRHCVPGLESKLLFKDREQRELFRIYCNEMSKIILIDSVAYRDAVECVGHYRRLRSLDMAEADNFLLKCLDYAHDNRKSAEGYRLYSSLQQYAGSLMADDTGDYSQEVSGGIVLL